MVEIIGTGSLSGVMVNGESGHERGRRAAFRRMAGRFPDLQALAAAGPATGTSGRLSRAQRNDKFPRTREITEVEVIFVGERRGHLEKPHHEPYTPTLPMNA